MTDDCNSPSSESNEVETIELLYDSESPSSVQHGVPKKLLASFGDPEVAKFSVSSSFRACLSRLCHLPPFSYSNTREEKIPKLAGVGKFKDLEKNDCNCSAVHASRNEKGRSLLNTNAELKGNDQCALLVAATLLANGMHMAVSRFPHFIAKANYDSDTGRIVQDKRDSFTTSSFILFNSTAFVASLAIVMSILRSLPLRPWSQITVFIYYVSYMSMIMEILPLGSWLVLFLSVPLLLLAASGKLGNFEE